MGLLNTIKNKILGKVETTEDRLQKFGAEIAQYMKSNADIRNAVLNGKKIVSKVQAVREKVSKPVQKIFGTEPITSFSLKTKTGQEVPVKLRVDPLGAVGSMKNVAKEGLDAIGRQLLRNIKKATPETIEAGKDLIKRGSQVIAEETKNVLPLDEVVKIRKRGNGTVKITRGELETMSKMPDLAPSPFTGNFLKTPIRMFEKLGNEAKELFYRPAVVAEGVTTKTKNFWNKEFQLVTKGLNQKSSERIMKYALSLEKDGQKILEAKNIKAEPLSAKETEVYNYIRQRYDTLLDQLNEARAIVGKSPINKRDNYISHIRDLGILEDMGFNATTDDVETLLGNFVHRNQTAFGFAKKRTGALKDVELDAFNVFNKYQERAIEHIYMTPAIAKLRELTRNKIVDPRTGKSFNLRESHPAAFKEIQMWIDRLAGQKPTGNEPKKLLEFINRLGKNVAFSTLAYNLTSISTQPFAIVNAITELGVKNTMRGIRELMFGGGDFAIKKSNVLEGRQFDTVIKDIATGVYGKSSRAKKKLAELGLKPLQILDSLTAQATWLGAYNRATTQLELAGEKAINYADDIVTRTQASASKANVAKIQSSVLGKAMTQFQTFVINDFDRILTDVLGVGTKMSNSQRIKKALTYITAVGLANYVSEDILGIPSPLPRPIKALKEEGVVAAGKEIMSQVPIVGGGFRYGSSPFGAVANLVTAGVQKASGKYTQETWTDIASKLLGVPGYTQLKRSIKGITGLEDGFNISYYLRDKNGNIVKSKTTGKPITKKAKIKITDSVEKARAILFGIYNTKTLDKIQTTGGLPKRK